MFHFLFIFPADDIKNYSMQKASKQHCFEVYFQQQFRTTVPFLYLIQNPIKQTILNVFAAKNLYLRQIANPQSIV